jgi:hypothetical protein
MHGACQFFSGKGRIPGSVGSAARPDFGDNHQITGIGMKSFADELIDDVRAVIVAGIDMIDTTLDRFAQHRKRTLPVLRRSEHPWARKLHGSVPHSLHAAVPQCERADAADIDHDPVPRPRGDHHRLGTSLGYPTR